MIDIANFPVRQLIGPAMLRYTRSGPRTPDFVSSTPSKRLNWEFYAVVDGECSPVFSLSERPVMHESTLWVMPPGLSYGWTGPGHGWERILFHYGFIPDTLKAHIGEGNYLQKRLDIEDINTIRRLVREVEPYVLSPNELSNLIFHRALIDLSLIALKDLPIKKILSLDDVAYQRVEAALSWYMENMRQSPTMDAVAAAVNVSSSHLRRHFHQVKHCSPNVFFQKLRMEKACKMLNKTTETLDQIARECGYRNSSDFCRAFQKFFRTTPHTWRKRITPKQPFAPGSRIEHFNPGDKRQNGYFEDKTAADSGSVIPLKLAR
jgi:AraC family transcriptional regulator